MQNKTPTNTYLKQEIDGATPGKLLIMLYDGAIKFIKFAEQALISKDIERSHNNLIRAQNIIYEFMITLDLEKGGDIAENLMRLYDYVLVRLEQANIKKDPSFLPSAVNVLTELRAGWKGAVEQTEGINVRELNVSALEESAKIQQQKADQERIERMKSFDDALKGATVRSNIPKPAGTNGNIKTFIQPSILPNIKAMTDNKAATATPGATADAGQPNLGNNMDFSKGLIGQVLSGQADVMSTEEAETTAGAIGTPAGLNAGQPLPKMNPQNLQGSSMNMKLTPNIKPSVNQNTNTGTAPQTGTAGAGVARPANPYAKAGGYGGMAKPSVANTGAATTGTKPATASNNATDSNENKPNTTLPNKGINYSG